MLEPNFKKADGLGISLFADVNDEVLWSTFKVLRFDRSLAISSAKVLIGWATKMVNNFSWCGRRRRRGRAGKNRKEALTFQEEKSINLNWISNKKTTHVFVITRNSQQVKVSLAGITFGFILSTQFSLFEILHVTVNNC